MTERVVIVFGLSGSGKSTLAEGIAARFGLRKIHPSSIVRDLLEGRDVDVERTRKNEGFWESEEGVRAFRDRLGEDVPVDVAVNEVLLREVEIGNVVIDSWSLPWMTDRGVRLHLRAGLEVRARRVAARSGLTEERAREVISMKDEETRLLFKRLYGFDIIREHQVFHHTLDTEEMSAGEVLAEACILLEESVGRGARNRRV